MTRRLVTVLLAWALWACGGSTSPTPAEAESADPSNAAGSREDIADAAAPDRDFSGCLGNGTAPPATCEEGDVAFSSKGDACRSVDGTTCYSRRNACGAVLWCRAYDREICNGVNDCPSGSSEIASCNVARACAPKTTCGRTIFCQQVDPTCDLAPPTCADGDRKLGGSYGCRPDVVCYTSSNACGVTVWCERRT